LSDAQKRLETLTAFWTSPMSTEQTFKKKIKTVTLYNKVCLVNISWCIT